MNGFGAAQAREFAWLLRGDVRRACAKTERPDEAFQGWWLVNGRREYAAWGELNPQDLNWLREPASKLTVCDLLQPAPRALSLVAQWRPDVLQHYRKSQHTGDTEVDVLAFAGWFYAIGLMEHALTPLISPQWVQELDRPIAQPHVADAQDNEQALRAPAVTVLMALVWHSMPKASRNSFALDRPADRLRYMAHFFRTVCRSPSLQRLVASRWRSWLLQSTLPFQPGQPGLPRFARFSGPQPSGNADTQTVAKDDALALAQWASRSLQPGAAWAWLKGTGPTPPLGIAATALRDAPRLRRVAPHRPFGINLFGFAYGELGIGEDVRMAAQACDAAGIPYRVVNVDPGDQVRQADRALQSHLVQAERAAPYAFNVFCMPAFDMVSRIALRDGPAPFEGHYNIGWWPWELPVWPRRWAGAFDLVDEVWAASSFTQAMYAASTAKPVTPMPLAVSIERLQVRSRRSFGLPAKRFLFLFVFDFNSHLARKNPDAVLDAFALAFNSASGTPDSRVGLVIKTMNTRPDNPAWQRFAARCAADKRITLMEHTLDREHVLGLVQACDAYVSLHRSEGFGRTLAEALLLGKPVVATDFSGTADFITDEVAYPVQWTRRALAAGDYPFVEADDAAWWAEPDVAHAAAQMRAARAAASPEHANAIRSGSAEIFSPQRVGHLMRDRLQALAAKPALRAWVRG